MPTPLTLKRFARTSAEAFALDRACAIERWRPTLRQRAAIRLRRAYRAAPCMVLACAIGAAGAATLAAWVVL